jgi:hypothetical protein
MESNKLKTIACAILILLCTTTAFGQTFAEFFKQKKTQEKYLIEQIAALEVYTGYLKKGYKIASSGIHTIRDFKNGEFSLHDAFISSLKAVSPSIRNDIKVAETVALAVQIDDAFNGISIDNWLSVSEQNYIREVQHMVRSECDNDLEELLLVITSGKIEMTEAERVKRLDKVYLAMKDKSAFTQNFTGDVALFIRQKENEQRSVNRLKKYYGIID